MKAADERRKELDRVVRFNAQGLFAYEAERRGMFDFTVKGSVVGFNTSQDGTKTFVKIQPPPGNTQLQRDERCGYGDKYGDRHEQRCQGRSIPG